MRFVKFIIFLIVTFSIFEIAFNMFDNNLAEVKVEIIYLLVLGIFGSVIVVLGKMYQKNFLEDDNRF